MDFSDVVGILGGIAAIVAAIVTYKNAQATAKKAEVETLREIIDELKAWRDEAIKKIDGLKAWRDEAMKKIDALECEVKKWKAYALTLCDHMRARGMEPPSIEDV